MGRPHVAAFTDTYLPTVNGVTYTVQSWRDRYTGRGGEMDIVYPRADGYTPDPGEHPVASIDFPFYDGYRLGFPQLPDAVRDAEVVHTHTPFGVGLAGLRLARANDARLVASYHTPTSEYAEYLLPTRLGVQTLRWTTRKYERWFFDHADLVLAPSAVTRDHIRRLGVDTPIEVLPNGVDTTFFEPVDPSEFLSRHDVPTERSLVGYTGRHGYEKRLHTILEAAATLDVAVVFGGSGPATDDLKSRAEDLAVDAHFLGFLDREELPAFYSALDVLAFPSPVETQGLVALEANACGTPVVGADSGALADTVDDGETGYRFPTGDVPALRAAIEDALADHDRLRDTCLDRRSTIDIDDAVDRLETFYDA
ncbi:MAG: glycosyltransferase [Halobacteriaceae archaeon]